MREWSDKNFSEFPWRHCRSPYEILVAEVLLKRTTASAAARIYERFLNKFPSLEDIVSARDEDLVGALSSVGLQRQRAHSMKQLAAWLLSRHGGTIPSDLESLLEVPGLGNYSAAAILSFGYGVPVAVLDANVERILLRVFGDSLLLRPSRSLLHGIAQELLPQDGHREYNYGLLDLGRLVCRYGNPKCGECPLASVCDFFNGSNRKGTKLSTDSVGAPLNRLRSVRRARGLSLKRLAESARVSKLTVIRIETGRSSPRHETLEKLAQALRVRPEELVR